MMRTGPMLYGSDEKKASGRAHPLDQCVEGGHGFDVLRLPGFAFLLQRGHRFLALLL